MASKGSTDQGHQGQVRDPEHDGRLKQNRERGETKGTTEASARRAEEAGHEPSRGGHKAASEHEESGRKASPAPDQEQDRGQDQAGSSDLKDRAYRGKEGKVHHHTRKYREQHEGEEQQQGEAGKGRS